MTAVNISGQITGRTTNGVILNATNGVDANLNLTFAANSLTISNSVDAASIRTQIGVTDRTVVSNTGLAVIGVISTSDYTVATLPAGTVGDRAYVTDAAAPTYNGALTGGGTVRIPVFRNATVWVSA